MRLALSILDSFRDLTHVRKPNTTPQSNRSTFKTQNERSQISCPQELINANLQRRLRSWRRRRGHKHQDWSKRAGNAFHQSEKQIELAHQAGDSRGVAPRRRNVVFAAIRPQLALTAIGMGDN